MTLKRIKSRADPNFLLREHALRKDQLVARRTDPVVDRTDQFEGIHRYVVLSGTRSIHPSEKTQSHTEAYPPAAATR